MKRILVILSIAFVAFEGMYVMSATNQPQKLGAAALQSQTAAQLAALASNTTGYVVYCSDCLSNGAKGTICVSTGVAQGSFVLSTGTRCN